MNSISHFLDGKVLLVTGSTGFVAKGLVEKLLRCVPDIQRIYLLVRPRRQSSGTPVSAEQRLAREVFHSRAFEKLRNEQGPAFDSVIRQKVVAVSYDLAADRLGIDPEVYARLTQEVDIVISVAGTVVFDERLDLALEVNTLGPQRLLEFAKACPDAIFLHVSTAYVNGQLTGRIPEVALRPDCTVAELMGNGRTCGYDLDAEIASIRQLTRQVEEASQRSELQDRFHRMLEKQDRGKRVTAYRRTHQLEALRIRWIGKRLVEEGMARARQLGWHDCYTLTKAMGEQVIVKTRGDLPTAIVRPSIIESSLLDPEPGWLEDLKVADPLIAYYGKGRLPDFPADPDVVIDVIPVDFVVNAIIAALPRVREEKEVKVYQVATGSENPMRLGEMFELVYDYFKRNPMQDKAGRPIEVHRWNFPSPKTFQRNCRLKYKLPLHTLGWLMDHIPLSSRWRRKVSMLEATFDRIFALSEIYSCYTNLNCEFQTENTRRLYEELTSEDQETFNFDVSRIEWQDYIQNIHIPGLQRHVLKTHT